MKRQYPRSESMYMRLMTHMRHIHNSNICTAEVSEALVVDHAAGEADQDRSQSRDALGVCTFQMAEVAVPRELFAAILERIQRFGVPPPLLQHG